MVVVVVASSIIAVEDRGPIGPRYWHDAIGSLHPRQCGPIGLSLSMILLLVLRAGAAHAIMVHIDIIITVRIRDP